MINVSATQLSSQTLATPTTSEGHNRFQNPTSTSGATTSTMAYTFPVGPTTTTAPSAPPLAPGPTGPPLVGGTTMVTLTAFETTTVTANAACTSLSTNNWYTFGNIEWRYIGGSSTAS